MDEAGEFRSVAELALQGTAVLELRALHAYRDRMQREVVLMRDALDGLANECALQLDRNTPALPYMAGAFNAYLAARRMHDRLLLLCEEAAGEAAQQYGARE